MRRLLSTLCVAALTCAACAGDGGTAAPGSSTTAAETNPSTATQEEYTVGRRSIELVDPSRPTGADPNRDLSEQPDRTLPVLLLYPATGEVPAATDPEDDAPVADGSFPLVVFSHGVTATGPTYEFRIKEWARAGYIVAAPTFPLSSGPGGLIQDYVAQPADVSFVIDELLRLPDDDPLARHIDPEAIAAAGHSLGAITTLGVSLNSCCADERLDAAVELSGLRLPFPDGDFDDLARIPFLAIHGAEDDTIPVSGSDTVFAEAPGPSAYLRLPEAGHSDFLVTRGGLVDAVVVAFLDRYLRGDQDALADIPDLVAADADATFEVKPAA